MWKRSFRSAPAAAPPISPAPSATDPKDPESCTLLAPNTSSIVDTETGVPSSPFAGPYNKDSQLKRRPGSVVHYMAITVAMFLLYLLLVSSMPSRQAPAGPMTTASYLAAQANSNLPWWVAYFLPASEDLCANDWRPEPLIGKCFGLEKPNADEASASWEACRSHCCGSKECVTWQFQSLRGCLIGGPVRLGLEQASPSAWCEETAPAMWQGRKLATRTKGEGGDAGGEAGGAQCAWATDELVNQCFGLGPERQVGDQRLASAAACQQWCCDHEACETWQWREDKGCFGGKAGHCEEDNEPYIGARKCVEGFC